MTAGTWYSILTLIQVVLAIASAVIVVLTLAGMVPETTTVRCVTPAPASSPTR